MKIGMIDVDNRFKEYKSFPNLPLMKLSAYHKKSGDSVEFYNGKRFYDLVYASKVFSFTGGIYEPINAKSIKYGGSGYNIELWDGREYFRKDLNKNLPYKIEHIYPDYDLYKITDTAYGFMSRGCPRNCPFCIVSKKEGKRSCKVANLSEFWNGQKYIELLDPNTLACSDWENILDQLIDSDAYVNFNAGVDIRLMSEDKAQKFIKVKTKYVHFAYDQFKEKEQIERNLKRFAILSGWDKHKVTVYILVNFNTTLEQDLYRVNFVKQLGFQPYIMRYNKSNLKRGHILNRLARYVNSKRIFWKCETFNQYLEEEKQGLWH